MKWRPIQYIIKHIPPSIQAVFATVMIFLPYLIMDDFLETEIGNAVTLVFFPLSLITIIANATEAVEHCAVYSIEKIGISKFFWRILILVFATILQFTVLYFVMYYIDNSIFTGMENSSIIVKLSEIFFYSFENMVSGNLSSITANSIWMKFLTMLEIILGVFYFMLIIGNFSAIGKAYVKNFPSSTNEL